MRSGLLCRVVSRAKNEALGTLGKIDLNAPDASPGCTKLLRFYPSQHRSPFSVVICEFFVLVWSILSRWNRCLGGDQDGWLLALVGGLFGWLALSSCHADHKKQNTRPSMYCRRNDASASLQPPSPRSEDRIDGRGLSGLARTFIDWTIP